MSPSSIFRILIETEEKWKIYKYTEDSDKVITDGSKERKSGNFM